MSGLTSMHYASNLEDKIADKSALGHYANEPMPARDGYQADQGWDELFTDYLNARSARAQLAEQTAAEPVKKTVVKRTGATILEITSLTHRRKRPSEGSGHHPRS